ncbi:MAG: DUF4834 family protein [Flexibacteraceae bacterium]
MLKFLAFTALFYFIFWHVFPFILRYVVYKKVFKMGGNPYDTFRKAQEQQQANRSQKTNTTATKTTKPLISDNQGEYIDYEEVK